jgi:hypothetical protein
VGGGEFAVVSGGESVAGPVGPSLPGASPIQPAEASATASSAVKKVRRSSIHEKLGGTDKRFQESQRGV